MSGTGFIVAPRAMCLSGLFPFCLCIAKDSGVILIRKGKVMRLWRSIKLMRIITDELIRAEYLVLRKY